MEQTTAQHLAELTNDPAFHAWQAAKAARENRARTVTNLLAATACVLLVVTMALLKPAATGGTAAVVQQVGPPMPAYLGEPFGCALLFIPLIGGAWWAWRTSPSLMPLQVCAAVAPPESTSPPLA